MKITSATVVTGKGPDHCTLETDLRSPIWPYDGNLSLRFECAARRGQQYVREHFGVNATVIRI